MIQDTTFQQIWTRHVSKHELEALPEQETNTPKANPRAIDKWAQEVTHRPKGKVGGPTRRPADQPGRPTSLVGRVTRGPTDLALPCGGSPLDA